MANDHRRQAINVIVNEYDCTREIAAEILDLRIAVIQLHVSLEGLLTVVDTPGHLRDAYVGQARAIVDSISRPWLS